MKRQRYEQLCEDVAHGIAHKIEHDIAQREGTIIACRNDTFIVETTGETESWARHNCHPGN